MKAVVFTLGCKVNSRESESLMSGLIERGYEVSDKLEKADIYIINTCAVTAEAEKKSRQAIWRAKKYNPKAEVYVCGCASQKNPEAFAEKGAITVFGAKNKDKLLDYLGEKGTFTDEKDEYYEKYLPCKTSRTRAYIKIQDGCNNFCSYCIIPYLRGRSRSRKWENVLREIEYEKPLEAVLTGINLSDYHDGEVDLAALLGKLSEVDCRIRLGSLEESVIDKRLLEAAGALKNFAPHFHLSLQSGSDSVLKAMNRHYTALEYSDKLSLVRSYFSDCAVTTDVIVGYSAETDEDFEQSLQFCKEMAFADIHCFPYSPREGTVGSKLKEIDSAVKRERLERMMELKARLKSAFIEKNIGKVRSFIPEEKEDGFTIGYTENYIRVYVGADCHSQCDVTLIRPFKDGALAQPINGESTEPKNK